ncbi:MAG: 50S ribosomal protein L17, partial [Erysipelotrichales bacterium]
MAQRKLGRTSNKRKAMLRALTTDLIIYGRIETTEMRAKEVKRIADKMVTLGKKNDLAARRQAASFLINKTAKVEMKEVEVNVRENGKV